MDGGTTITPKETPCRLLVGVNAKNLTTPGQSHGLRVRQAKGVRGVAPKTNSQKRAIKSPCNTKKGTLHRADGEADEAGEDAEHAEEFFPRVGFFEEKQAVGKAYHRSAAADGTHHSYQTVRIAKRQHIDVVADDEKQAYQDDNAYFLYGVEGGRWKAKGERWKAKGER